MEENKTGKGTTDRLIRMKELKTMVGYSQTSIWRHRKNGSFPHPVRLGSGSAVAWRLSEVIAWINTRQTVNVYERRTF